MARHRGGPSIRVGRDRAPCRQLGLVDHRRVVDEHPLAAGEADPAAVGVEALGHEGEHVVGERAEATLLVEEADRPGRLREEHVGGRLLALLLDEQRQVGGVAVANVDVDARLLRESIEDRLDQVLRPARVDRDRATAAGAVVGATPGKRRRPAECEQREDPNRRAHLVKVASPRRICSPYLMRRVR